ncbi:MULTISPECIES: DUF2442 domain-containing protein [Citrobacter]|jgi:hypothetical protein|uniref:DUF2442 domain-containing protein n=1 Tax=Citrobacter TaxID=544 RepID=UPI0004A13DCF|nr:hypothetical protein BTW28_00660 [Citrobacter freundii]ARC40629.1 DUF2442 domain-containing protein [Citrobacter braakii]KDF20403.1 hypothetical protein AF42_00809 [Citrobacter freundii MGH 56]MBY1056884.1 DUF2442 domain-containing protein [Citrobacter europaeus]MCB6777654.1 DUF2442 domain-containing protein [Citrobacter sp. 210820-DFI.7.8]MCB6787354.1 DUF2442 domain-containing protein [Citrobacter sp. 210820-DFI.7.7]
MLQVKKIRYSAHHICLELQNGLIISVPFIWFPLLKQANIKDLKNYRITKNSIEWPNIGEAFTLTEILNSAGYPYPESMDS